jgi:uncharacterized membrane protein YcaP (DUF421 family)
MITVDELMAKLREHGIERVDQVKAATMESDGEISIIKHEGETRAQPETGKDKAVG